MAFSTTTFYNVLSRLSVISSGNLPTGYFSSFGQSVSGNAGAGALAMDVTVGAASLAGQKSFQNTFSAITTGTNQDLGVAQFVSSPLAAQSHASETWSFFAGVQVSNATASFVWKFRGALYLVNGSGVSVGTVKTTIVALSDLTGTTLNRTNTDERTVKGTATGASWTAADNDYLVLEWGVNLNNTSGGSLSPNVTIFGEGITGIAADNATTSNANTGVVSTTNVSVKPIYGRAQISLPPLEQPRGGVVRTQMDLPPNEQTRGGVVRTQMQLPINMIPRSTDIDTVVMRAFDSSLNKIVYWVAAGVDPNGLQYNGNASALSDITSVHITSQTGG